MKSGVSVLQTELNVGCVYVKCCVLHVMGKASLIVSVCVHGRYASEKCS